MKLLSEHNFRDLQNQFVYIEMKSPQLQATGIIYYCYLNHLKGLCFKSLTLASFELKTNSIKFLDLPLISKIELYAALKDKASLILPLDLKIFEKYKKQLAEVLENKETNEEIMKTRGVTNLDTCRAEDNPDVVMVHLIHGEAVEVCFVLLEGIKEMGFYGLLLQEPKLGIGVHKGETINFYNVKNPQGIMCISVFE